MSSLPRLLALAGADSSGFFHVQNPSFTPHRYQGFSRTNYQARGEIEILEDSSTVNDRYKTKFKIPQHYHTMGSWVLKGTFDSLLGNGDEEGAGATVKRFINWAPREQIDEVRFRAGQTAKKNIVIPGRLIHTEFYVNTLMREKETLAILELGDMSQAERSAAALTDQAWEVVIPNPWDIDLEHHLPISTLQDELEIEIVWKQDSAVIQYDGATPMTPITRSDVTLYVEMFMHFLDQYNYQIQDLFKEDGIEYYKRDCQYDTFIFDASAISSTGDISIDLTKFNHECPFVFVTLRYEDETEANPAGNLGYDNLLPWVSHEIKDGALLVQGPIPYKHQVYRLNAHNTFYPIGLNAIIHSNALDITDRGNCSGSHNYAVMNKGTFRIKLDPDVIANMDGTIANRRLSVDFNAVAHNVVSLLSKTKDPTDPRAIFSEMYQIN